MKRNLEGMKTDKGDKIEEILYRNRNGHEEDRDGEGEDKKYGMELEKGN